MKKLGWIFVVLSACITADKVKGTACTATKDCAAGLFCAGGKCTASDVSGAGCTAASDCPTLHACVNGHCSSIGCDANSTCHSGCCSSGQCVDGTTSVACGKDGTVCGACGSGATCTAKTCTCASCAGTTVCAASGCAECGTSPCSGATPVCDTASHACQSCVSNPSVCSGATPFCNDSGSCSSTPDNSAACARRDPAAPVLVNGSCGCDSFTVCPNNLACDTAGTRQCFTQCTLDSSNACASIATMVCRDGIGCEGKIANGQPCTTANDCTNGSCDCANPTCTSQVCASAACAVCGFTAEGITPCGGALTVAASGCKATDHKTCDGLGTGAAHCKLVLGQICANASDCDSGNCSYGNATGTALVCSASACSNCQFVNADGTGACQSVTYGGTTTAGATPCNNAGSDACNGAGACLRSNGQTCGTAGECLSNVCEIDDANGGAKLCVPFSCGACKYAASNGYVGSQCQGTCFSLCNGMNKGASCGSGLSCDAVGGTCRSPGSCSVSCGGAISACVETSGGCNPGATAGPSDGNGLCASNTHVCCFLNGSGACGGPHSSCSCSF